MKARFIEVHLGEPNLQAFQSSIHLNFEKPSFYSVVYFGILLQLSRLKGTFVAGKTLNELNKALDRVQGSINEEVYKFLKEFMKYTESFSSADIKNYLLKESVEESFDHAFRIIVSTTLRNEFKTQYSNEVIYGKEVLKDEEYIFNALTKILKFTISIYSYNSPNPFIARTPNPNPELNISILYDQNSQNSWSLLVHFKENLHDYGQTVNLDDLPFTYSDQSQSLPAPMPIPMKPEVAPVQTAIDQSALIEILAQIVTSQVGWMPEANKLQLDQEISKLSSQNPAPKIACLKRIKSWIKRIGNCSHDSSSLLYFYPCHKVHCKLCIQDKIDKKQLTKSQISCPCGMKIPNKFKDKNFKFPREPGQNKNEENPSAASSVVSSLSTQESLQIAPLQEMCEICKGINFKQFTNTFPCGHKVCKKCWEKCNKTCYKCYICEICRNPLITGKSVYIYQNIYYHFDCTLCQICSQSIFQTGTPYIYNGKGSHLECQRGSRAS
ncbi:unnamed protein product [Blepharisma stoltei]|uniref:RING-type domain-containing protein n=1 Tax=Blepharisma stoltei TaxID=1481888 RepID=A0AAU9K401_9CILI|nr:unnamed protein product [Blepharisma stoltei]